MGQTLTGLRKSVNFNDVELNDKEQKMLERVKEIELKQIEKMLKTEELKAKK